MVAMRAVAPDQESSGGEERFSSQTSEAPSCEDIDVKVVEQRMSYASQDSPLD